MVPGMIMLWHGTVDNVPSGWHLCDGTLGTPNLRNRFIVGAGDAYNPGDNGGANTHQHTFTTDGHTHALLTGTNVQSGTGVHDQTGISTDAGTTDPADHRPKYYALCYIMKV